MVIEQADGGRSVGKACSVQKRLLEAEVDAYIAELAGQREGKGACLVVRNGYHQPQSVRTTVDVGLRGADDTEELIALSGGYRESSKVWSHIHLLLSRQ